MASLPPTFNPDFGDDIETAPAREVFPDGAKLVQESIEKHGRMDSGYRVSRVPDTNVYVLYGVDEASHFIQVIKIRTHRGSRN